MTDPPTPHVFISYRHHDGDHGARIQELVARLRSLGFEVRCDLDGSLPADDWLFWMANGVATAAAVVVVVTPGLVNAMQAEGPQGAGSGVRFELRILLAEALRRLRSTAGFDRVVPIAMCDQDASLSLPVCGPSLPWPSEEQAIVARLSHLVHGERAPLPEISPATPSTPAMVEQEGLWSDVPFDLGSLWALDRSPWLGGWSGDRGKLVTTLVATERVLAEAAHDGPALPTRQWLILTTHEAGALANRSDVMRATRAPHTPPNPSLFGLIIPHGPQAADLALAATRALGGNVAVVLDGAPAPPHSDEVLELTRQQLRPTWSDRRAPAAEVDIAYALNDSPTWSSPLERGWDAAVIEVIRWAQVDPSGRRPVMERRLRSLLPLQRMDLMALIKAASDPGGREDFCRQHPMLAIAAGLLKVPPLPDLRSDKSWWPVTACRPQVGWVREVLKLPPESRGVLGLQTAAELSGTSRNPSPVHYRFRRKKLEKRR